MNSKNRTIEDIGAIELFFMDLITAFTVWFLKTTGQYYEAGEHCLEQFSSPRYQKAIHYFNISIKNEGNKEGKLRASLAAEKLAQLYENGLGVPKSKEKAAAFYKLASQGKTLDGSSANNFGVYLFYGIGVSRDRSKAEKLFYSSRDISAIANRFLLEEEKNLLMSPVDHHKAITRIIEGANSGHNDLQYELGELYKSGCYVDQDLNKADEWLRKSAQNGHTIAQYEAAEKSWEDLKNQELKNFHEGLNKEDPTALYKLAIMSLHQFDHKHMIEFFRYSSFSHIAEEKIASRDYGSVGYLSRVLLKSAKKGHAKSQYLLGLLTETGKFAPSSFPTKIQEGHIGAGVFLVNSHNEIHNDVNYASSSSFVSEESRHLFKPNPSSVFLNDDDTIRDDFVPNLDSLSLLDTVTQPDYQGAIEWYTLAAEQGHETAKERLLYLRRSRETSEQGLAQNDKEITTVKRFIQDANIQKLVHFTRYENLESILKNGIVTRDALSTLRNNFYINDSLRLDGHEDSISVSISFPNHKMFYKYRMETDAKGWVVISIKPELLWKSKSAFCKYNAADIRISKRNVEDLCNLESLEEMFLDHPSGIRMENRLKKSDPTDPQAEILIFDNIPIEYIVSIGFEDEDLLKMAENKFEQGAASNISFGMAKDYFKPREYVR